MAASTYSATLTLPTDAQLTSAGGYTIEYDARLHKSNGMGRYGRYTQVAFIDSSNAAKDSRDYMAHTVHCSQAVIQVLKRVKDIRQVWHLHCRKIPT